MIFTRAIILISSGAACVAAATVNLSYPAFTGKFPVGTTAFPMTDASRDDPLATSPQKRTVLVTLYYPTTPGSYPAAPMGPAEMLEKTKELMKLDSQKSFADLKTGIFSNSPVNCRAAGSDKLPLVLFSPGMNAPNIVYGHIAADLASHGYLVAAVDSPFDAALVEFPDGTMVYENPKFSSLLPDPDAKTTIAVQNVRIADLQYVMSKLISPGFNVAPINEKLDIDTSKIGVFGHSLGGSSSAKLMAANDKVGCGINMDGTFFDNDNSDLGRPFMGLSEDEAVSESWTAFLNGQKKVKPVYKYISGSQHLSFCDLPVVLDLLGERVALNSTYPTGTIKGSRMNADMSALISSFFNKCLMQKDDGLLAKESDPRFPEVHNGPRP